MIKHLRFIGYFLAAGLIIILTAGITSCSQPSTTPFTPTGTLSSINVVPSHPDKLTAGTKMKFTATGTYSDGSTADITSQVTWKSSDTSVATMSSSGTATGIKSGATFITAAMSGVTSPEIALTVCWG